MKKRKLRVLFAAFEAAPFVKTGGLGDVAGSLPGALRRAGADARLILPKAGSIPEAYTGKMQPLASFETDLGWRRQYVGVQTLRQGSVPCYFIDNEYYFRRDSLYGYADDGERAAFFSKAVLDALPHMDFRPDVIICNDWHTALIPVLYRDRYESQGDWAGIRTVLVIHNLRFQGICRRDFAQDVLGMTDEAALRLGLAQGENVNFLRSAALCSDEIVTVSPTYAGEIQTAFYGEGLDGLFRANAFKLTGILNGIDYKDLDPASDKAIPSRFTREDRSGKAACKAALQVELGLETAPDTPLLVLISRLTEQKGLELLLGILDELMREPCQLAILGTGYPRYEDAFRSAAARYPGRFAAALRFDARLSRRMYAGADLALIPSLFEPCGLTQMMAMRYGTLPVVRETGGLRDRVAPYNRFTGEGNGFSFANFNAHEFLFTLKDAMSLYRDDRSAWDRLVDSAMATDFSWSVSARRYLDLLERICGRTES